MKLYLGILAATYMLAVSADEILEVKKASDVLNSRLVKVNNEVFSYKGKYGHIISSKTITIDPAKKYKISVKFRAKGKLPDVYLGFVPFNAKNVQINPNNILDIPNSLTTLAAPARKGDKVLMVTDASKWKSNTPYGYVAFGAKADFSDMPNYDLAKIQKNSIAKKGNVWTINLIAPLAKDYAKGTAVRQQSDGGTYIYCRTGRAKTEWTKFEGIASGILKHGSNSSQFWAGTKSVRVLFMTLSGDQTTEVEFKDLEVELVK